MPLNYKRVIASGSCPPAPRGTVLCARAALTAHIARRSQRLCRSWERYPSSSGQEQRLEFLGHAGMHYGTIPVTLHMHIQTLMRLAPGDLQGANGRIKFPFEALETLKCPLRESRLDKIRKPYPNEAMALKFAGI